MTITISFTATHQAEVEIDGRKLRFGFREGEWGYTNAKQEDKDMLNVGSIVAMKLTEVLPAILQNWIPEEEHPDERAWGTWERLPYGLAIHLQEGMKV